MHKHPPMTIIGDQDRFRKDLFYRLAVVLVRLPPLREREKDTDLLTGHFLERFNRRFNRRVTSVSPEVLALFRNYAWPGNIRELAHVIEGAMNLMDRSDVMTADHVTPYFNSVAPGILESGQGQRSPGTADSCPPQNTGGGSAEKEKIQTALTEARGKIKAAAGKLGISRQLLHYRIKKYGIDRKAIADGYEAEALEKALAACDRNLTRTAKMLGISLQLLNYRMKKHGIIAGP